MSLTRELSKGERLSGSADERRTFEFIEDFLAKRGYKTQLVYESALISLPMAAELEVIFPQRQRIPCNTYSFSPSTPSDGVIGRLVDLDQIGADRRSGSIRGAIAISRGLAAPIKAVAIDGAGAGAEIHVNDDHLHEMCISPVWGSPTPATLDRLPKTPAVGVTAADGAKLRELLRQGEVTVRVVTRTTTSWQEIPTLTAHLSGRDGTFVLFSGHVDSWYEGAMDNASGNAAQLAIAELLARHRDDLQRGVRFAFWSGHSHGRYAGSTSYVDRHWQELHNCCICHVNVDSIGGVGANVLTAAASMAETYDIAHQLIHEGAGQQLEYRRIGRAGDQSFWGIGIPSLFDTLSQQPPDETDAAGAGAAALTGSTGRGGGFGWWWHTAEDTIDRVDPTNLLRDARVYAAAMWELTVSDVLPIDFARAAAEIRDELQRYQDRSGAIADFKTSIQQADELRGQIETMNLHSYRDPSRYNDCLRRLGHILVPLNYTATDRFDQDPALHLGPIPSLPPVGQLATLGVDSSAARPVEIQLRRARNRILQALLEASELVSRELSQYQEAE